MRLRASNRLSLELPDSDEVSKEWREAWAASVPAFADKDGLAVTYTPIGKGRLITICSPWSLSNEGIAHADNLPFVLDALGGSKDTQVVFDEYHHGYGENVAWALTPTWARWALAQFALAFLLLVYASSRRFGRIVPLLPETRERSEFLTTMTALLRKGEASRLAVRTAYEAALRRLRRELGLPDGADLEEVGRAARRVESAAGRAVAARAGGMPRGSQPPRAPGRSRGGRAGAGIG